jgi:galactose mutarotase-like enzyme
MTVRFSSDWTYRGLRALVLENAHLRVTFLPELGGKIWSIVAKQQDREMLWHNPRIAPRPASYGSTYDNWFCGGWDEVFPNDYPVTIDGEPYPDHGEIWSLPAEWEIVRQSEDEISIRFTHSGVAIPTTFSKVVSLKCDSTDLELTYEIANDGASALNVHWKMHPALPVSSGAKLHLPARTVIVDEDFGEDEVLGEALPDPDSGTSYFQYGTDLSEGRCAVTYPDEKLGFGLAFDSTVLTSVWLFATFGGWRALNTIILEPCTGHFANLEQAIAARKVLTLAPKTTITTGVIASILLGTLAIDAFTTGGNR